MTRNTGNPLDVILDKSLKGAYAQDRPALSLSHWSRTMKSSSWHDIPTGAENIAWDHAEQVYTFDLPTTPEPTPMPDIRTANLLNETDMHMIPQLLERVANTIVSASSFAKDVERMRSELDSLSSDLKTEREQAITLRETVASVTAQRDEARDEAMRFEQEAERVRAERNKVQEEYRYLNEEMIRVTEDVIALKTERDDAQFANLELTDKLAAAEAKLAKFRAIISEDVGTATSAPTVQEAPPAAQPPLLEAPSSPSHGGGVSLDAPEPTRRIYRNDDSRTYYNAPWPGRYDEDRGDYYVEVPAEYAA